MNGDGRAKGSRKWWWIIGAGLITLGLGLTVAGIWFRSLIITIPHPPPAEAFGPPGELESLLTIKSTVRIVPALESPEAWLRVLYDVELRNISGSPIRNFVAYAWIDEAVKRWITNDLLIIGPHPDDAKPVDLVPGQFPFGVGIGRGVVVPHPGRLSPTDLAALRQSLERPIWLRLAWEQQEHLIRIPPEQIEVTGLELLQAP